MKPLSLVADELHEQYGDTVRQMTCEKNLAEDIGELMIVIQHDAQMVQGKLYSADELFQRAVAMTMYAESKNARLRIDLETQTVIMEPVQ